jgi:hypothetical protein
LRSEGKLIWFCCRNIPISCQFSFLKFSRCQYYWL